MNEQYKILYLVTKSALSGASRYICEIVKGLPKNYKPYFIMSDTVFFLKNKKNLA